jgi:heme oxygenase (biliverdin-producing, ferredoxin)
VCVCFTEALLDETKRAYFLHRDIFDEIEATTRSKTPEEQSSKMFSVTAVLTFMLAVGLAHFLIVVGGMTGSRGYAKLEAIQTWIFNTVSSD